MSTLFKMFRKAAMHTFLHYMENNLLQSNHLYLNRSDTFHLLSGIA